MLQQQLVSLNVSSSIGKGREAVIAFQAFLVKTKAEILDRLSKILNDLNNLAKTLPQSIQSVVKGFFLSIPDKLVKFFFKPLLTAM